MDFSHHKYHQIDSFSYSVSYGFFIKGTKLENWEFDTKLGNLGIKILKTEEVLLNFECGNEWGVLWILH